MAVETLRAVMDIDTSKASGALAGIGTKVNSFGKGIGTAAKAVGGFALGIAGAATAAFVFVDKQTKVLDAVDKGSQRMGISSTAYQEWAHVLNLSGTSIDGLEVGMKKLSMSMADAQSGGEANAALFQKLGVEYLNADGSLKSLDATFPDIIKALSSVSNETERNVMASELFGKAGMNLIPVLNMGEEAIEAEIKALHESNAVMSGDAVKAGAGFQDMMTRVQASVSGLFGNLAVDLIPIIEELVKELIPVIGVLLEVVKALMPLIVELLPLLVGLLKGAAWVIKEVVVPALLWIIETLKKVFTEGSTWIKAFYEEHKATFDKIWMIIKTVWDNIVSYFKAIFEVVMGIWNTFSALFRGDWEGVWSGIKQIFGGIWGCIVTQFQLVWNLIVGIFGDSWKKIMTGIAEAWANIVSNIAAFVQNMYDTIYNKIKEIVEAIKSFWGAIWTGITTAWTNIVSNIKLWCTSVFNSVYNVLSPIIEKIRLIWGGIWTGITTAWTNILTNISIWADKVKTKVLDIFSKLKTGVGEIWSSLAGIVKIAFNAVIRVVNWGIDKINSISIKIPDWVPGMGGKTLGFNLAKIPELAEGGIVRRPTLAMIGEAGPEAVIPLGKGNNFSGSTTIIIELDSRIIAQKTLERMPSILRLKGVAV